MDKDCMFQYALGRPPIGQNVIIESTDRITREEAEKLWDKYYMDMIKRLENGDEPQMCIWINCKTDVDYHTMDEHKSMDYRDNLKVKNGKLYLLKEIEIV